MTRTFTRRTAGAAFTALVAALVAGPGVAQARDFSPGAGTYTADTTALTLTGPGTSESGRDEGGVAVFSFDDVDIPEGVRIEIVGSRPFELRASEELTLAGTIDGSGQNATDFEAGPFAGGPGAGPGGGGDVETGDAPESGEGPGGGSGAGARRPGGGGGGFGGAGADGGSGSGADGGAGGVAYGDLEEMFQAGSGGAAGSDTGGGGGGGGIKLSGRAVSVASTGVVRADGGGGATGNEGASGGGSGGGIIIRGETVDVDGLLSSVGGDGGAGGCCGDGGGGGGGHIAYHYRTLQSDGTANVSGGTTGARSTGGCCDSSGTSPDPRGSAGAVTKVQAPTATTRPATSVTSDGATLNGVVNPNSAATTYHFEYGTDTNYGSRAPTPDAAVGSDAADRDVDQVVSGLRPETTYHYRVVATNSLGFRTSGADMTFTTSGAPAQTPAPASNAPFTEESKVSPTIGQLAATRRCVRSATLIRPKRSGDGLAFSFSLSQDATVTYEILRRVQSRARSSCRMARGTTPGTLEGVSESSEQRRAGRKQTTLATTASRGRPRRMRLRSGRRQVPLARLAAGQKLAPGTYVLRMTAANDGGRSAPVKVKFWVLRSKP